MADNGVREPVHIDIELTVLCEYIKLQKNAFILHLSGLTNEFCNCKPSLVENDSCAIESTKKKFPCNEISSNYSVDIHNFQFNHSPPPSIFMCVNDCYRDNHLFI